MQADELELSIDRAVPLGLILNEIATNSIKHAFGPDGGGRISVKLVAGVGYGEARLSVADNGRGVKEDNPKGTGLKLVAALARQIGGTIDQDSSKEGNVGVGCRVAAHMADLAPLRRGFFVLSCRVFDTETNGSARRWGGGFATSPASP